jgi:hypothetical protein
MSAAVQASGSKMRARGSRTRREDVKQSPGFAADLIWAVPVRVPHGHGARPAKFLNGKLLPSIHLRGIRLNFWGTLPSAITLIPTKIKASIGQSFLWEITQQGNIRFRLPVRPSFRVK